MANPRYPAKRRTFSWLAPPDLGLKCCDDTCRCWFQTGAETGSQRLRRCHQKTLSKSSQRDLRWWRATWHMILLCFTMYVTWNYYLYYFYRSNIGTMGMIWLWVKPLGPGWYPEIIGFDPSPLGIRNWKRSEIWFEKTKKTTKSS